MQPLDSAPTLRRMILNGDSKRDYISREASLVVKGNGVYAVKGAEEKGRFPWKFEYLVDDRRNGSGDKITGEKVGFFLFIVYLRRLMNTGHSC